MVFRVVKGSLRTLIFSHLLKEVRNQNKKRQSWKLRLINSLIQQVAAETSIPFFLFSLQSFSWLMRLFSLWWCVRRSEGEVTEMASGSPVLHLFFSLSLLLIRWALRFEKPENNQAPEQDDGGFGPARPLVVSGSMAPQTRLVHPLRLLFLLWAESSEGASIYFELTGSREDALTRFWAILHLWPQNTSCDPSDFLTVVLSMVLTSRAI